MTRTTSMNQRAAYVPNAALMGPAVLVPMSSQPWADGIANPWECGNTGTHGFTAKRSTRRLGRWST